MKKEIDLIVKKFLNNETIAFDLIQEYGNDTFENELITRADNYVKNSLSQDLPRERKALICVALTMIAIRYYDGNMWDHIRKAFVLTYKGDLNQKADAKIRSILQLFKKDCNYSNPESLIAVPITAAGVTHYWLPSFFDFCFAIYKENLLARRDIGETDLQTELKTTFESMRINDHLSETEDVIRVSSSRSYKLSKYTQSALMTGTNTEGLACIGSYCIRSIIKCLNDEEFRTHPYYENAFEEWKKSFFLNKTERAKLTDSGKWKIVLEYQNGCFYLITKTEKVSETYDPKEIKIQVLENGVLVYETDDVDVTYGIGGLIVGSKKIKISCNILNKLSYRIVCGESIAFDCGDRLYKNHQVFFFNERGEQIHSGADYKGNLIVVTEEQPTSFCSSTRMDNFYVSSVDVVPSGDYVFDKKRYAFKTIRKPGLEGTICKGTKILTALDNECFEVYSAINSILIETRSEKDQIYITIDNKDINVNSLDSVDYPVLDNGVRQFKILLPKIDIGMHRISVNSIETRKPLPKCIFTFVLDPSFHKTCERLDNGLYQIKINSTFVNGYKDVMPGIFSVSFKCSVPGRGAATLEVSTDIISVSIDGNNWLANESRINAKNFDHVFPIIYLIGTDDMVITVSHSKGSLSLPLVKSRNNENMYEINLGSVLALYSLDIKMVKITIKSESSKYDFYVDFVTHIDLFNSVYDYNRSTNSHHFSFSFEKDCDLKCEIIEMSTKRICYSKMIKPNEFFTPINLRAFVSYKIILTEKGSGLFSKDKVVAEIPYFFSNTKELIGHIFDVYAIEYYAPNDSLIRSNISKNETTLKFLHINKHDLTTYVGTLKCIGAYGDELRNLGLLKISTEAEFEGDYFWVYITDLNDDDQLLFDEQNKRIFWTNDCSHNVRASKMPGIERYLIKHK